MNEDMRDEHGKSYRLADALIPQRTGRAQGVATIPRGSGVRPYGGALVAQMLVVASWQNHPGGAPHSVHAHFLHEGSTTAPVFYRAEFLRRSRNFTTLWLTATQDHVVLCSATISFHTPEMSPSHAGPPIPPAGDPERASSASGGPIPALTSQVRAPFDLRAADGPAAQYQGRPALGYWLRVRDPLEGDPILQAAAMVWASDFTLTRVADVEHEWRGTADRKAASLDHAIWFHRVPDLNVWTYYEVVSPIYRSALALSTGRFLNLRGELVASTTQESLLRRAPDSHAFQDQRLALADADAQGGHTL